MILVAAMVADHPSTMPNVLSVHISTWQCYLTWTLFLKVFVNVGQLKYQIGNNNTLNLNAYSCHRVK